MEETIRAVGGLLLNALPTFFLLILLHFYLKVAFYKPLEKVLGERRAATEGAREKARRSIASADAKAAEYEEKLRTARGEIYKEQEALRKRWLDEQTAAVAEARASADAQVRRAREALAADAAEARKSLEAETAALAEQIARSLLERRAA